MKRVAGLLQHYQRMQWTLTLGNSLDQVKLPIGDMPLHGSLTPTTSERILRGGDKNN